MNNDRNEIVNTSESMPEYVLEAYIKIKELLAGNKSTDSLSSVTKEDARARYSIALLIKQVADRDGGRVGPAMEQLASAIGWEELTMCRYKEFGDNVSQDEFERMLERAGKFGADPAALLRITAEHEAGHAVMRWLVRLPATEMWASEDDGFTFGTGRAIASDDAIQIYLAGYVVESCYGLFGIDFRNSSAEDFERVYEILSMSHGIQDVREAIKRHFEFVCLRLVPHAATVKRVADALEAAGHLSATRVAAILREESKRK